MICFAWFLCRRKDSRVDVPDQFCLVFVQEEGFEGRCVRNVLPGFCAGGRLWGLMSLIGFVWFWCRRKDSRVDVTDRFCLVFVQEEGFEGRCV